MLTYFLDRSTKYSVLFQKKPEVAQATGKRHFRENDQRKAIMTFADSNREGPYSMRRLFRLEPKAK